MSLAGICNPRWRPPEITKGFKYDRKVDVYSYGLVLNEMLTGKIPFEKLDGVTAAAKSAYENVRPEIPDTCPVSFASLMQRCWFEEPAQRPEFSEICQLLSSLKEIFCNPILL